MPEKETTYYEIALSARQVLVTFVVALTCISLAFFAGLWVGQQDEGRTAVADAGAGGDEAAPALGFFTDDGDAADGDDAISAAEPDEAGSAGTEETVDRAPEVAENDETPARGRRNRQQDGVRVRQGQVAASGSIILQVLASSNRTTAESTLASLRDAGHSAYLQPIDRGDSTLYRVRVGPFADRVAADEAKQRIDAALNVEALITTAE